MIDIQQLKIKMARYCAWRERCTHETREKLIQLGANDKQISGLLHWLYEENYLNDQRFALSFAQGKFIHNKWGNYKIISELKARKIDQQFITEAIDNIDEEQYTATAKLLATKKWHELKDADSYIKKQKTASFLAGKGFETDMAWKIVESIDKKI